MPNVTNLPLRTPAIVAKAAATLSLLSGGRVELGIEAEYFADQIEAYGGPQRSTAESFAAFEEAISVMRALWGPDDSASYEGQHYHLRDAKPEPLPANPIRIWAGAVGPRMLRLTGAAWDGWVPANIIIPPDRIPEMQRRVDSGAHGAGRDTALVRRGYNILGIITDAPETRYDNWLVTTPQGWVDTLVGYYSDLVWTLLSSGPRPQTQ